MKTFKLFLCALFIAVCLPVQCYAASENLVWNLSGGTLTVSGSGEMPIFESPEEQPWYDVREQIEEVYFVGVENMRFDNLQYYFTGCINLRRAEIPYTTKVIGTDAFANCPNLTEILFYYYDSDDFEIAPEAFYVATPVDTKVLLVSDQPVAMTKIQEYMWAADNRHVECYDVYAKSALWTCPTCGRTGVTVYSQKDAVQHVKAVECPSEICGTLIDAKSEDHTYNNYGTCTKCGYVNTCVHENTSKSYSCVDSSTHTVTTTCKSCGFILTTESTAHSMSVSTCIYCAYYVVSTGKLSELAELSVVELKEDGMLVPFYVVKHDYEPDLNGTGYTLLLRKDIYNVQQWCGTTVAYVFKDSDVYTWLRGTYKSMLTTSVRSKIKAATYYHLSTTESDTATTASSPIFIPSAKELGLTMSGVPVLGSSWSNYSYIRRAYYENAPSTYWLRSYWPAGLAACYVSAEGALAMASGTDQCGVRPCFLLPSDVSVMSSGEVKTDTTITWDVDGTTSTSTFTPGTTLTLPTTPTKTGYTFKGWYTAPSSGTKVTTSTVVPDTATTYYAQWTINSYTLTWNVDGTTTTTSQNYNTNLTLPTSPTKTGYTFKGWYTASSSGTKVTTSTKVTANKTYYAQWTINSYTITWNIDGATSTTSQNYNTSLVLPTAPTKTGYTFKGWFTSASSTTQVTTSTKVTANKTYYAQWTIHTSTLTINPNGGTWNSSTSNTSKTQNYNTTFTVSNPTIANYTATFDTQGGSAVSSIKTDKAFSSWTKSSTFTAGTLSGTTFTFGSTKNGTGTLTAKWSGSHAITLPTAPTKTGYTFKGWYTAASSGTKVGGAGDTITLSANKTYYAQWTPNTYTLTLMVDGAVYDAITQTYDQPRIFPADPTKPGYTFKGWYSDPVSEANKWSTSAKWDKTVDRTIYAHWTPKTYTITWDTGSGTSTSTQTYDTALVLPTTNPTKTNAHFDGWYTSATGGTKVTASTVYQTVSNTTYYAQYTQAFSVTVPTTLPLVVDPSGNVVGSTISIGNMSTGAVKVSTITLHPLNDWSLVPYTTDMSAVKVDSKLIGLKLNDLTSDTGVFTPNWTIAENSTLPLQYDAVIPAMSSAHSNESMLSIVFVIEWATS